ncbi:hypothetical protein [Oceanobacillus sojae]|uniref:hypothetical protein n=1 Tax=Oceanobacillus sojae TaxID=582851 RepID=UPI0009887313|nr:hypothetical protein [Oceanobacillus sojae]
MSRVIDFGQYKQEKLDRDALKQDVRKTLSVPMQALYVAMIRQSLSEATGEVLGSLDSIAELGLSRESAAEVMDIFADEFMDVAMAAEYIADELRGEGD